MNCKHVNQSYPRIEFTQDVYEKHLTNMERIAALALNGRSGWDKATATPAHGWRVLTDSMGWEVLSLQAPSPTVHEYLCLGTLRTSLSALQQAFYVKNTHEFRAVSAVLYEDAIADAALLNLTHRQTADDLGQFFGVKYLKLLVQVMNEEDQEQEYIYLEFSGTRIDARGRKTWFIVTEPVAIRPVSDAKPTKMSTSGRGSSGSDVGNLTFGERCSCVKLFREMSDGCVEVTVRTKLEAGSSFYQTRAIAPPSHSHNHHQSHTLTGSAATLAKRAGHLVFWKTMGMYIPSGLAKDLLCLSRSGCVPEARRLTTGPFAQAWEHGSKCKVCFKSFNLLRRKHHCRRCGSSMCSTCTVNLYCVDRPTKSRSSQALAVEKFCKSCLVQAKIDSMRHRASDAGSRGSDGTNSAANSDANHRVAYLHSPARNANGDHFFLNDILSHSSLSLSHASDVTQPIEVASEMGSAGPFKPPLYTPSAATTASTRYAPAISMVSTDFSEYDLPVHRHAPAQAQPPVRRDNNQRPDASFDVMIRPHHVPPRPPPPQPHYSRTNDAAVNWDDLSSKFQMVKLPPSHDSHVDAKTASSPHFDHIVRQSSKESTTEYPHHRQSRPPMSKHQQRY